MHPSDPSGICSSILLPTPPLPPFPSSAPLALRAGRKNLCMTCRAIYLCSASRVHTLLSTPPSKFSYKYSLLSTIPTTTSSRLHSLWLWTLVVAPRCLWSLATQIHLPCCTFQGLPVVTGSSPKAFLRSSM